MNTATSNNTTVPNRETLLKLYRDIRLIRRFEETGAEAYHKGLIQGYFHTCLGQEGVAAGACEAVRLDDYIVSTHRGHGHCIAKGADIKRMMADLFGTASGYSNGRGGSMHIADRATGNIGANGIVGGGIPLAGGVGMGIKVEGSDKVVLSFFGDGAANNGVFAETVNMAGIFNLPVLFILENNGYAATTHISETTLCNTMAPRAAALGVEAVTVSGNDPLDIYNAVLTAADKARKGKGPTLIEAMTYRYQGHHINDKAAYVPDDHKADWEESDPLDIMLAHLKKAEVPDDEIESINSKIEADLLEAVTFAENDKQPDIRTFLEDIKEYDI